MKEVFSTIIQRDLNKLKEEISLFPNDHEIWIVPSGISNSPGNLCLHICGNLKYFIGAVLGNIKYKRIREKEFTLKNIPSSDLISEIEDTNKTVTNVLAKLDESILKEKYPIEVFDYEMTTEYFLVHLVSHLNYHLGQINYLRRIIIE